MLAGHADEIALSVNYIDNEGYIWVKRMGGVDAIVRAMLAHGSALGSGSPIWSSSIEMLSGDRTNAIRPSRGGRLITTPLSIKFWQKS